MNAELEVRITTDGSKDVINGITDWVYEGGEMMWLDVVFAVKYEPDFIDVLLET